MRYVWTDNNNECIVWMRSFWKRRMKTDWFGPGLKSFKWFLLLASSSLFQWGSTVRIKKIVKVSEFWEQLFKNKALVSGNLSLRKNNSLSPSESLVKAGRKGGFRLTSVTYFIGTQFRVFRDCKELAKSKTREFKCCRKFITQKRFINL